MVQPDMSSMPTFRDELELWKVKCSQLTEKEKVELDLDSLECI